MTDLTNPIDSIEDCKKYNVPVVMSLMNQTDMIPCTAFVENDTLHIPSTFTDGRFNKVFYIEIPGYLIREIINKEMDDGK